MRLLLAIVLLSASAYGQIANPPTSGSIVDATATGRALIRATNAEAARSAIGLGSWAELNDGANVRVEGLTISDGEQGNYTQFGTGGVSFNGGADAQFRDALNMGSSSSVTFSNVTLLGINSTAANQAASSGASLITRDLMYQAQADFNSGDLISSSASIATGVGSSSSAFGGIGFGVQISIFTNSAAGVYIGDAVWSQTGSSGALMPANKTIDVTFKGVMLRVESNTNFVNRLIFGVGAPNRTPPPAGTPAATNQCWGVNFFYNGTNQVYQPFWFTTNYFTGPIGIVPNLSDASWTGRVYTVRLRQTSAFNIAFFINDGLSGRLSATPTWSTNVVWPSVNHGGRLIGMECASATNATVSTNARIHYRVGYIKYDP
jgi:hypothetical protein